MIAERAATFRRRSWLRWLKYGKRVLHLDTNLVSPAGSRMPLDVLIPALDKDRATLPFAVTGLRRYVRHPVGEIILVGPENSSIPRLSAELGCRFVPEDSVLPITRRDIRYHPKGGEDRSGWLFQQLLKLSADSISKSRHVLVYDADTVLLRPHVFVRDGKPIFHNSDEWHPPYFEAFRRLLGERAPSFASFIAHHMLFDAAVLGEARAELEARHDRVWYEAILGSINTEEPSAFSEYEFYGNYFLARHGADSCVREYWFNVAVPRRVLGSQAIEAAPASAKSISFHSYWD